ncbi:Uncharacterized conserved protein YndB, AHSA1/START domain [Klenkia soli]|uniref:Uncharacterized conserved protein YndB, AHSA1/START domain n=1 Tax=Klenkia soli TaxID=1052260 RepID=A0A1H0GBY5_9ACTN|nr:SRPBCC family protein [Klenkia soli]SDO04341.1 Uncharacterized conserved protein YndB, AHSA1/START domain [Klenkia soli]
MSAEERFVVSRIVPATPQAVFAVLADPTRHRETEPGNWVRDALDPAPITAVGQVFGMHMAFPSSGKPYVMHNRVVAFEPDRVIAWEPGQVDDAGELGTGGWTWRYELAPEGDGTAVTLTYDWSATPQAVRDEIGGLPAFPRTFLDQSLEALEQAATG